MTKKKVILFVAIFSMLVVGTMVGHQVSAEGSYLPSFLQTANNVGTTQINVIIRNIIEFVFAIAGLLVLGFIIFAGFKFITSGGDSGKKEEAQKQIVAAVIGLLIIVFSFFIVQLIFSLLGLGTVRDIKLPCGVNQDPTTSNCIGDTGTVITPS